MTRASTWVNSDGLRVGFGPNYADYSSVGVINTDGLDREIRFVIDGERFSSGTYSFEVTEALPVGAVPLAAHVRVTEVFALGGTTPTIQFGSTGSGAGSIFGSLSEANAEALGTYTLSVTATPLTSTTAGNVTVTLGGTTPTVTSAGKAVVTLIYRQAA